LVVTISVSAASTYIYPDGDVTKDWDLSSGRSHYALVDESIADDDGTYVYTSVLEEVDSFDMQDPSYGSIPDSELVINYVNVYYRCRSYVFLGPDPAYWVNVSLHMVDGGDLYLLKSNTFYNLYSTVYSGSLYNNPVTNEKWTKSDLEDLEVAIRLDAASGNSVSARCTQIRVLISYTCTPAVVNWSSPGNLESGVWCDDTYGVNISFNTSWWGYNGARLVRCYKYWSLNNASWTYVGYTDVYSNDTVVWLNVSSFNEFNTTYYWRIYCYDTSFASRLYNYQEFTTKDVRIIFGQLDGDKGGPRDDGGYLYDEVPLNNTKHFMQVDGWWTSISIDYTNYGAILEYFNFSLFEFGDHHHPINWYNAQTFDAPFTFGLKNITVVLKRATGWSVDDVVSIRIAGTNETTDKPDLDQTLEEVFFNSNVVNSNDPDFYTFEFSASIVLEEGKKYAIIIDNVNETTGLPILTGAGTDDRLFWSINYSNPVPDGTGYFGYPSNTWDSHGSDYLFAINGSLNHVNVTHEWWNESIPGWEQYAFETLYGNQTVSAFNANFSSVGTWRWRVTAVASDTGVSHSEWYQFKTFVLSDDVCDDRDGVLVALGGFVLPFGLLFWRRRKKKTLQG
jgi:hypothetical protein